MRDDMPTEIKSLIAQCEAGVSRFSNDQMSAALHFAESLWTERCRAMELAQKAVAVGESANTQWALLATCLEGKVLAIKRRFEQSRDEAATKVLLDIYDIVK
jgi:hypothetical protein